MHSTSSQLPPPFGGLVLKAMWTSGVEENGKLPEENLNLVSHSRVTSPDRSVASHDPVVAA